LNFGDKGWDSAEYLTDVPLNETLFSHNDQFQQHVEGDDALTASFNEVDDQVNISVGIFQFLTLFLCGLKR
jgi:hypothetical protein